MARGITKALKSKAENKKDKKIKADKAKSSQEWDAEVAPENKLFNSREGGKKRSLFATIFIKAAAIFLLLYVWSFLYVKKYYPYIKQNEVLIEALKDPSLIKHAVMVASDYEEYYNDYMVKHNLPDRIKFFEKIRKEEVLPLVEEYDEVDNSINDDDDEEVPVQKEKKEEKNEEKGEFHEIQPENDYADAEIINDIKEEIMGGEIYTVDEIFKKLGIEKISDYKPYSEYEKTLLKEFKMDREMPDNIAKKADYYKPVIERGLKEDERFFVKKINDKKGYGLFASVDIPAHEVLGVYTGIIKASESENGKKYEWYYSTIPDRKKEAMVELRVNGKSEGSALRFVNHSLFYNSRIEYVPYNNQWYILFVSNRFINRGEEITVNYREKTKRMPAKIIDKWDKTEEEEYKKLYEEYMNLKKINEAKENKKAEKAEKAKKAQEAKAPVKEEL